jgi:hypothetical protein
MKRADRRRAVARAMRKAGTAKPMSHADQKAQDLGKKRAGRLLDGVLHDGRPA